MIDKGRVLGKLIIIGSLLIIGLWKISAALEEARNFDTFVA